MLWHDITGSEMKLFDVGYLMYLMYRDEAEGLTVMMGIVRKPTIHSYWNTDDLMVTPFFLKPESLSRDRYLTILQFLRFSDPYQMDCDDRNSRVAGFIEAANSLFKTYVPQQNLSFDESMMLHKGRLNFKVFIRTKRARFGVKLFVLADSEGVVQHMTVYYGKNGPELSCRGVPEDFTKSEIIVIESIFHNV